MSFISNAAHQKFIMQCQDIISTIVETDEVIPCGDKNEELNNDLIELQQLMNAYLEMLLALPKLTCRYYNLHRKIRINIRKIQQKKNQTDRKKLK